MEITIRVFIKGQTKRKVRDYVKRLNGRIRVDPRSGDVDAYVPLDNPDILARIIDIATEYGTFDVSIKA